MRSPITLVEPNPKTGLLAGIGVFVRNIVQHRQMIWEFVMRDIRLKYRDSAFGYIWSLLEPLLMALMFVVLFTILAHQPDPMYPMTVVVGVITWGFFASAATRAQISLTGNGSLIQQIYFPREVFGISGILSQLVMTALSLLVAIPFMLYLEVMPTWRLVFVPIGLLMITALSIGAGMGTACLNVLNRDVEYFFNFMMRAGLYVSPVMWTVESLGGTKSGALKYLLLNPITVPMTLVSNGINGRPINIAPGYIAYSVVICLVSMALGIALFRRLEGVVVKKL